MNILVLLRKSLLCRDFRIDIVNFNEFVIVQTIDDAIVEFKLKRALLEIEFAIMLFQSKHHSQFGRPALAPRCARIERHRIE